MNQSEKQPLIPMAHENLTCREDIKKLKKENRIFAYLLVLFFLLVTFNHHQFTFLKPEKGVFIGQCHSPSVPYQGPSSFSFSPEEYQKLKIEYQEQGRGRRLNIVNSQATVTVDESLTDVEIKINVRLSDSDLQNSFTIEQETEQDQYALYLKGHEVGDVQACARVDVAIKVPNDSALKALSMKLPNNDYELNDKLSFERLVLTSSNGHFRFQEGISVGRMILTGSNGSIKGKIAVLAGNVTLRTSNGSVDLVVLKIENPEGSEISVQSSNGHISTLLPETFDSDFRLRSSFGKLLVESTHPDQIHKQTRSYGLVSGYYGNKEHKQGNVSLTTSNGRVRLSYE